MPTTARYGLTFCAVVVCSLAGCHTRVTDGDEPKYRPVVTPQEGEKLGEHLRKAWRVRVPFAGVRKLYVDQGTVYVESAYNQLAALDEETGALRWVLQTHRPLDHAPRAYRGRLFFFAGEHLYVVDLETGKVLGQKDPHLGVTTQPVPGPDGVLLCSADGRAHAVDPEDIWPRWSRSLESVVMTAAVAPDRVYVLTLDSRLSAVDASTGHILWSLTLDTEAPAVAPAATESHAYVAAPDLQLHAFDSAGALSWSTPVGGHPVQAPVVVGDRVIVTVEPDVAVVLDADSGEVLWKAPGPHRFLTAAEERVYFLDRGGQRLLAFRLDDGRPQGALDARTFFEVSAEPEGGRFVAATRNGEVYSIADVSELDD